MSARKYDGDLDEEPRKFGHLHEADEPRDRWVSLGVHEGRSRPVIIDRDARWDDEHGS